MQQLPRLEEKFLAISLIFGMLFIFLTPPFQVADEDSHYKKAFLISEFILLPSVVDGNIGNYLPKELVLLEESFRRFIGNKEEKYSYIDQYNDLNTPADFSEKVFQSYSTSQTSPLLYLGSGSAIFLSKLFVKPTSSNSDNFATYLYAGRIGNLLLYTTLIYLAIKYIPFYKRVIALLGLMPMSMTLGASNSYDAVVIRSYF